MSVAKWGQSLAVEMNSVLWDSSDGCPGRTRARNISPRNPQESPWNDEHGTSPNVDHFAMSDEV